MKKVAITQRVETDNKSKERRDALDQRWFSFLKKCNVIPVILPNDFNVAMPLLKEYNLDGILFTGGNDLIDYGGDAPERDKTETFLLNYSIEHNIPLLGVCRGMQLIQHFFGIKLEKVKGHTGCRHNILMSRESFEVNSYHNFGTKENNNDEFNILAKAQDGVIEAIKHVKYPICGIMWHPEREYPFLDHDINLVDSIFGTTLKYQEIR